MKKTLFYILIFLFFHSCNIQNEKKYSIQGYAQGTTYNIIYIDSTQSVTKSDIAQKLSDFDRSCSLYNPISLINRINEATTDTIDNYIKECIEIATRISNESGGMYDITVKPLVEAYGFAAKEGSKEVNVDSLMQYVGYQKLKLEGNILSRPAGVQIDLNSIAQGYSVDVVSAMFDSLGIENYLVEIGGEIFCRGKSSKDKKWSIGIDRPVDGNFTPGQDMQLVMDLESGRGLATSGNYRKFHVSEDGERINHTLDPTTGKSATTNVLSATIIASSAALADGYATTIVALGAEKGIEFLKKHPELGAYIVYSEGNDNLIYEQ